MSVAPAKMNPFPGLRPFTQEEDYLFFGREEQTLELLQRLGSNRFVAVVGTSGSGKSSLVRCGLLSELLGGRMQGAGSSWEIAVAHPGGNPLALLTDSLLEADLYDREEEHARENLLATLSRSHFGLVEAVKQADLGEGTNFLLVVDQFEELFRFQDAGQRQQEVANEFVSLLLEAVAQKEVPIYVVLTMRSDFIGECGQFEGLAEMVNRGEFLIPRLTREQYKRVIEGPIKVAGGQIAPRLLQRLLNDLGQQADQLPCLQHALMRTWDVWAGTGDTEALDLDDYQRVGRMAEALSLHADEIYEALANDHQRELCRGTFQALTVEESNNRGIRRPQRLERLCQILNVPAEELEPIIDAYRHGGVTFLMPSPDVELTDQTIIDISHESLMRVWTRLRQWVEEESQAAGIYHRLSESAALHELGKAGLYRDPELGIALAWREAKHPNAAWAERYRLGFAAAMAFLEASQRASVAEEQAREAARQRELVQAQQLAEAERRRATDQARAAARLRWMVRGLGLVAMFALTATVFAWLARQEARSNADFAAQKAADADAQRKIAQNLLTDVSAARELAEKNLKTAELAQADALQAEKRSREFRYSTDVQLAATLVADKSANATQILARLSDHDPESNQELQDKEDLRGFEWHYLKRLVEDRAMVFDGFEKEVVAVAMSPEGELVTLDSEGRLRHFNPATRRETRPALNLKKGRPVSSTALSRDGRRVALAIGEKVHLIDTTSGEENARAIPAPTRNGLLFSPDGNMVITVDTGLGWWDAATGNPLAVDDFQLMVYQPGHAPASVSDDGLTVAVGGQGDYRGGFSAFRLDRPTHEITRLLDNAGDQGTKRALAISPDGQTIAVSYYFAGGISLYDTSTGKKLQVNSSAHPASISAIAFSPDSTRMVTAAMDGSVKVWKDHKLLDATESAALVGHAAQVDTLAWVASGKQVVSAGKDKTVRLWNLEQDAGSLHRTIAGAAGARARYSPDGTLMAVSGESDTIQLRDGQTGEVVARLLREDSELGSDGIAFSPDNQLLAVGFGGKQGVSFVELWDIDRRERLAVMPGSTDIPRFTTDENSGLVNGLVFSPDGRHLVAGFGSLMVLTHGEIGNYPLLVYDVASRRVIRRLEGPRNYCISVAFSPDGSRLASACYDGRARIWDTATWKELHVLENPDTASERGKRRVGDVAYSPDGKLLAMASAEGNVIVWDAETGTHLQSFSGHANEVWSVAFSPNGRTLASGSMDGTIRLWNTATWRELVRLDPGTRFDPRSLAFSPDGNRLLAGDSAKVVVWSIQPAVTNSQLSRESLAEWWRSGVDIKNRVRMQSEHPRLNETLETLASQMPGDKTSQAAMAATAANWRASLQQWEAAVEQFDRLQLLSPESPDDWLRMPGLLRLATALVHQDRPADAASLLTGGEKRRVQDGNGKRTVGLGIEYANGEYPLKLTRVYRGSPARQAGMRAGDLLLRFNDEVLTSETISGFLDLLAKGEGTEVKLTIQHPGEAESATVQPTVASYIQDDVSGELIETLLAAIDQRLTESPNNVGLRELRAELAGLSSNYRQQLIDYTAAIEALLVRGEEEAASDLARLYGRRGIAYVGLKQWRPALDDFAKGITDETADEVLLTNQVVALNNELLSPPQWIVLKPVEATSKFGAKLTVQADGSILASGANVDGDVYTITTAVNAGRIGAIRLETLPDASLPGGGPGRHPSGNFHLREFVLFQSINDRGDGVATLPLGQAWASFAYQASNADIAGTIDKDSDKVWHVWGHAGQAHEAVFQLADPVNNPDQTLVVQLSQRHPLGRFRLSLSESPDAITFQQRYLAALKISDPWTRLAQAYRFVGNHKAINDLVRRQPKQAGTIGDLFIQVDDKNNESDPEKEWRRAVEIYSLGITLGGPGRDLLVRRAKAYEKLRDWSSAASDWERTAKDRPENVKLWIDFAGRLSGAEQSELAGLQRELARRILEAALQADPGDAPAIDNLASLLLDISESRELAWTLVRPTELMTAAGNAVAPQADGSFLVAGAGTLPLPELPGTVTAVRVETASASVADQSAPPAFKDYRIETLAARLESAGLKGRYVRIDLPGHNSQFPRFERDGDQKWINLAELQVFRGDQNIALRKKASATGGVGRLAPEGAVDGNTVGNDNGNPYAHTDAVINPWWEVDLGSEQAIDRLVVWNRSDVETYPRMNHFRVRILDTSRTVVFEQVIDEAPKPSRVISCQSLLVANNPAADAAQPGWSLRLGGEAGVALGKLLRVSSTEDLFSMMEHEEAITDARNVPQPLARLAVAYDVTRASKLSADWFRRALDDADNDSERHQVLALLVDHPRPLAELLKQRPDDLDLQLAQARSHVKQGQKHLASNRPNESLAEFQQAGDNFARLLTPGELASLDVSMGQSLAQQDKPAEAAAAFVRALERVDDEAERKKLIEQMQEYWHALAIVAERRPQDLPIQLALARRLAERGKRALAENRQDEALPELARARVLFARLAAEHATTPWTVLQPTDMTSEGGADLRLEADGSIFVGGTNPDRDAYTISAPISGNAITALRLETIPDDRLPSRSAGRSDLRGDGEFLLAEIEVSMQSTTGEDHDLAIAEGFADFSPDDQTVSQAYDSNPETQWGILPLISEPHTAVFAFQPLQATQQEGRSIVIRLKCGNSERPRRNLGRFRLSTTTGDRVIEAVRFQQELKASGLTDLELALGGTYGRQGRLDEAATAFSQALDLATDREARTQVLQVSAAYDGVIEKLAELRSEDATFLDALARHHQASGDFAAARAAAAKARSLYEQQLAAEPSNSKVAGDLADILLESRSVEWTPLKPEEMKSAGGADLNLLDDNSILAGGVNPDREVYTITARPDLERITGFRLEALPDDSLPQKGPGRGPEFGNFHLNELRVMSDGSPVTLTEIRTLHDEIGLASRMIDGKVDDAMGWSNFPKFGQANAAFIAANLQRGAGSTLKFELHSSTAKWTQHNLGRFRISVTDTPSPLGYEQELLAMKTISSPWSRLGAAYHGVGEFDRALEMFARSIDLASSLAARTAAAQQAARFEDIFSRLQERFPGDQSLRLGQAKSMAARHIAEHEFQLAVDVLFPVLADFPNDIELLNQRAGAFMKLTDWRSAETDYARVIDLETDDSRRRAAERIRAEVLVRMGQFQAGADARLREMMLSPGDWGGMREAYYSALLSGNPAVARMAANRLFKALSANQDLDAFWSGELIRLHTAIPGLVTRVNQQRLLEAATKTGGDWTAPYAAAIHFRLGDIEMAQSLLDTPQSDREFQAMAAMLLYDRGETTRAADLLSRAARWLHQQSEIDPSSVIPSQVGWDIWAVNRTVGREAARKLIGPRIAELDELLASEPDRSAELLERIRLLADVGLYEDAARDLDRLVTLKVESPESLALHGRILAGLGRDEQALAYLNQAIDGGSLDGAVYAARGAILLKQARIDAARADLEESLRLKPNERAASLLADLLLAKVESTSTWTVLKPTEVISEGGATLSVLEDQSILASGKNPLGDAYRLVADCDAMRVGVVRIEALNHASLPNQGPGRDEERDRGNFDLVNWEILRQDAEARWVRIIPSRAIADYSVSHLPVRPTSWNIGGGGSAPHAAMFLVENPATFANRGKMEFRLQFSNSADWPKQNLGRFRISVSDDSEVFNREAKRLAAMKITDSWARLAAAYYILDDQQAFDKLIKTRPAAEVSIGELYATVEDWDRAIAAYSTLIGDNTTDASLLVKRGEAYFVAKQLDLARADWRRAVALKPELAQSQFDRLRSATRWSVAAEFGLLLIQQKPEDTLLWVQVAPVAVLSENDTIYPAVSQAILEIFRKAPTPENFERAIKACMLKQGAIEMAEVPLDLLPMSLDEATVPDWLLPWFWSTRALLAYRKGDAELAVKSVKQSEQHAPGEHCHALNLLVLAMTQHDLKHPEDARTALYEARQLLTRLQANDRYHHDTLIAEILFREAEAKINQ